LRRSSVQLGYLRIKISEAGLASTQDHSRDRNRNVDAAARSNGWIFFSAWWLALLLAFVARDNIGMPPLHRVVFPLRRIIHDRLQRITEGQKIRFPPWWLDSGQAKNSGLRGVSTSPAPPGQKVSGLAEFRSAERPRPARIVLP
jgi:hypothetical protein